MKKKLVAAVVIAVAVIAVVLALEWGNITSWYVWRHSVPDPATRRSVAGVQPNDVESVRLESLSLPVPCHKTIRDRAVVALLVNGLKEATIPEPMPCNRVDHITLILKGGKKVGPFAFSVDSEVDSFSPPFVDGLKKAGIRVPHRG